MFFIQRLKTSFLNSLWSEANLFTKDGPLTFFDSLIGWVPVKGGVIFCISLRTVFLLHM